MKFFKLYILFIISSLFFLLSCEENNDPELLFEDTPTIRTEKAIIDLRNKLQSSTDGWKMTYFTDDTQLGGFTFLFNFRNEEEVVMASDFGNSDPTRVSLYDITLGSTIKLSFTTKNVIHELSDGNNFPTQELLGQGYRGDFEFLFSSYDGDDIIFRVNRDTSNYIRFSKANADDWTNILNHKNVWESFPSNHMAYVIDGKISNFVYSNSTRFASNIDRDGTLGFGLGFTSTGVIVSPAIDVNGTLYSEFTLSADARSLVSEDGNFVISLSVLPLDMSISWVTAARPGFMPQEFIDVFSVAKAAHDPNFGGAFPLNDIFNIGDSSIVFSIGRAIAAHELYFTGVPGEPNQMGIIKSTPSTNWRFVPSFNPMVDLLESKSPYIVDSSTPGTPVLTSVADPTFAFVLIN